MQRPAGHSLFNPFNASANSEFGFWFVMIAIFVNAYGGQSSPVGQRPPHSGAVALEH